MYKYILQSVDNINWLAVASLVVFFVIFVVSALWAFMSKKEFVDKMAQMPLDDGE
jgi:cbb3-type cytochrome oxidase subunit 3